MERKFIVKFLLFVVLIVLLVWIVNPSALFFVNDDFLHIPLSANKSWLQSDQLRPISEFTIWLDYKCWALDARGYHYTNLVLHIVNCILLYFFIFSLFNKFYQSKKNEVENIAFITTCLFLFFPSHIESIFWILGRGASLATLFMLSSFILLLNLSSKKWKWLLSLLLFFLALLAYEQSFIFPMIISGMYYLGIINEKDGFGKIKLMIFWVLLAAFWIFRFIVTGHFLSDYIYSDNHSNNALVFIYNFNALVARTFLPPMASGKIFATSYLLVLFAGMMLLIFFKKKNKIAFRVTVILFLGYVLALLPFITLGIDTHDTESTRFLYFPGIFFIAAIVNLFSFLLKKLDKAFFCLVGVVFIFQFSYYAGSYKRASAISKRSINFLKSSGRYNNVFVLDLPSQYKGAMIFRSNFNEALKWQCPDMMYKKLIIVSQVEISNDIKHFEEYNISSRDFITSNASRFSKITPGIYHVKDDSDSIHVYNPGVDLILKWTDSSIMKIR